MAVEEFTFLPLFLKIRRTTDILNNKVTLLLKNLTLLYIVISKKIIEDFLNDDIDGGPAILRFDDDAQNQNLEEEEVMGS